MVKRDIMIKFDEFEYGSQRPRNRVNENSYLAGEVENKMAQAIRQKLKVEIEYIDENKTRTNRIIEPYKLFEQYGNNYVASYCYLRKEYRGFRIDRIKSISVLGVPREKYVLTGFLNWLVRFLKKAGIV